ncbi:MAG: putative DNA-binding domain-containing protein [Opitutae bacterium]|nr:putative DNA-binding domain-containing protein [Opitutae bacterium]
MAAKSKPFAPARVRSTRDLARLQRAMWRVISRPLTDDSRMQPRWTDGRPAGAVAAQIARPNDRLTSFERLEIYNRMYWFRVLDSLYDDCPGLRAVLGDKKFIRLAEAYLVRYPSDSFTLRNLPRRLAHFIHTQPRYTRPHTALCHDLARFEWARVEVFDTASRPVFTVDDLLDVPAARQGRLKLALQPYLQLLRLDYPVDDFVLAVKQREAELLRGDASNAPAALRRLRERRTALPRPARTHVAVHRLDSQTYFKRLDPAAYRILVALRRGATLEQALATGLPRAKKSREDWPAKVQAWFRNWMELGWLCRR